MKKSIPEVTLVSLLFLGILSPIPSRAASETKGTIREMSSRAEDDGFYHSGVVIEEEKRIGTFSVVARAFFRFYARFISPVDDRTCIFYPTCSDYARQAAKRHGYARGYALSAARLIRCNPSAFSKGYYPRAPIKEDRYRAYDPVP